MNDYLEIGEITKAHGIKGELVVLPLTDDPSRFNELKSVFIDTGDGPAVYGIEYCTLNGKTIIVKIKGIEDRTGAEELKGSFIMVHRSEAVSLPKHSYFICDIKGCEVFSDSGELLGTIKEVWQTGSNDVYEVSSGKGKSILIPALKEIFQTVDIENKRLVVKLPEGLIQNDF